VNGAATRLQQRAAEFLKSPAVLLGGAALAGLAISRILGASQTRDLAARFFFPKAAAAPTAPEPAAAAPAATGLDSLLPALGETAKKMLVEFLSKKV
jgi:hypothetical protein